MKILFIRIVILLFTVNLSYAQQWMKNLEIAQDLALVQNKMVLMVWEGTTKYPYPVWVKDSQGRTLIVEDLFTDEALSPLIWKSFVPVIVSENRYADLLKDIKGKRNLRYLEKFEDDSIKIMDANGIILNTSPQNANYPDITALINNYALNTEFIVNELRGYKSDKNFYSAFYLASKYLDFSLYTNGNVRVDITNVSEIYLKEAMQMVDQNPEEDIELLKQRVELLDIQKNLILKRPRKALRQLNRMDAEEIKNRNTSLVAFLYFTSYTILNDQKSAAIWKEEVSLLNLKKAMMIYKINS